MDDKFLDELYSSHRDCPRQPSPERVEGFFTDLLGMLFPAIGRHNFSTRKDMAFHLHSLKHELSEILFLQGCGGSDEVQVKANAFFALLPEIKRSLQMDIDAMFAGDPAAQSTNEVVRTYPGFYAIAAYRFAHELFKMDIQIVPRLITEHAHSKTGIDIHPGATIGESFCIDHGTGIVIGATTLIGDHVKIYQGVTLGALSVNKEDAEIKRHPTIEDHVVIYAGATILGGRTIIGNNSVVGGNVWLTKSIPPYSKVYYQNGNDNPSPRISKTGS